MIPILIFIISFFAKGYCFHYCPYPLPSHIRPCVCILEDDYQMSLTCDIQDDFAAADFDRIMAPFDYNHNIFTFKIDLHRGYFYGQLNRNNIGRLNITHFIMQNVQLNVDGDLIREGAFEGSYGSIETIHIYSGIVKQNGTIDLDKVLSNVGPTLNSLKLSFVNHMRPSSFLATPNLSEIVFVDSTADQIPTNTFSGEHLPKLTSIELNKCNDHITIQANAFENLMNLTSVKLISLASIENIERSAFNNLPCVQTIEFFGSTIGGIEEDSFANLTSLQALDLTSMLSGDVAYLPRIINNSPLLTTIKIAGSSVKSISEDFFIGTPKLQSLSIKANGNLEGLVIRDLNELNSLDIFYNPKMKSLTLKNLPSFTEFNPRENPSYLNSASFLEMENLEKIYMFNNDDKLETLSIESVPNLQILHLESNRHLNHTGLTSSLHQLFHPNVNVKLGYTNVRELNEFTFRPLIERFNGNSESKGKIDLSHVGLDCGCDVKWLVVDIGRTDFFINAKCVDGTYLADVDPFLLEMMCPPDY